MPLPTQVANWLQDNIKVFYRPVHDACRISYLPDWPGTITVRAAKYGELSYGQTATAELTGRITDWANCTYKIVVNATTYADGAVEVLFKLAQLIQQWLFKYSIDNCEWTAVYYAVTKRLIDAHPHLGCPSDSLAYRNFAQTQRDLEETQDRRERAQGGGDPGWRYLLGLYFPNCPA